MAEISSAITYTVRFAEREYKLMTKGLALLAGLEGPKATPEDRQAAAQLNDRLLDQQATDLREKLAVAEHKRNSSTGAAKSLLPTSFEVATSGTI